MNGMRVGLTLLLLTLAEPARAESFVYVSVAGEDRIAVYQLDENSGELSAHGEVKVSGGPGALCLHPSGEFLLASIKSVGNLASFRIADDGTLTQIDEVPAGADPAFLATDKSGKFLVSAYYQAGKVCVHSMSDDGKLSPQPLQTVITDEKAHGVVFDSSGKFVFVPHTGPNAIFQFRFDPTTGKLTANDPVKLQRPESSGPRHLWFRPDGKFAYGSDEQGNSVTAYRFDAGTGTLHPIETLSTLGKSFTGRNSTSDIEVHPAGNFVYVANRGEDTLAGFAIDEATGRITSASTTATETTTRSFNIDSSGKYLIAAGQNSGKLATFKIRSEGSLDRIATTDVGAKPWWVLIVRR